MKAEYIQEVEARIEKIRNGVWNKTLGDVVQVIYFDIPNLLDEIKRLRKDLPELENPNGE